MASPSIYEIEAAQVIMDKLFGGDAKSWKVSYEVIDELGKLLAKLKTCNTVMDALPRPGFIDKDYFRRQLRGIATRLKDGTNSYDLCKKAISAWREYIKMVSMGIN